MKQTLFVNDLTTIDFSYLDDYDGILGETIIVDVELEGKLDDQGMLMDFSNIKKDIKRAIDDTIDHSLAVPIKNKNIKISKNSKQYQISFLSKIGQIEHISPFQAITLIDDKQVTFEAIERFLITEIKKIIPLNINNIKLNMRYEEISGQFIQYSHGLRKHKGNCQRIAHGHRSKIIIKENGKINNDMQIWAAQFFKNAYFIDINDIRSKFNKNNINYISLKYKANQGDFELTIAQKYCHILNAQTTIENLSKFIWDKISKKFPNKNLEVKFFEGVNKGAVFY